MSGYGGFAAYYDVLTGNVDYRAISGFIYDTLKRYGLETGIVLDLACGTGSLCELMSHNGYDVIGVDGSEDMLSEAWNKKVESGADILYLCQDMTELDLYGTVDAAFCTLDSLNHLSGIADLRRVFERVALFLNPGGIFIFDCNTEYKHSEILANNTFVYDCDDVYCVWQNTSIGKNSVLIHLDLFNRTENATYLRSEEEFQEIAFSEDEIMDALSAAGMTLSERHDGYTAALPCNTTQRIVYIAKK